MRIPLPFCVIVASIGIASSCAPEAVSPERYTESDELFRAVEANVAESALLSKVVQIDHSRMAAAEGAVMGPARVLIFSSPELESELLAENILVGIDLPLRVLAYEEPGTGAARLICNRFEYLASRYGLGMEWKEPYEAALSAALAGIEKGKIAEFRNNQMAPDGIVALESAFDFEETERRVMAAIESQDDTVVFGTVDFQENARPFGIELSPVRLVLFGAPVPGAKAMINAPTLGLDAFCQKLLIWRDGDGVVRVGFNDLVALADRQGVGRSLPLRVIQRRVVGTFREAIGAEN